MATAHNGFPPALASMAVRAGPGDAPSTGTGKRGHVVGLQRLELQGARATGRQIIEQPDHVGRQRRRPGCHHDKQRRERQLPCHRQDRQQACAVRPMDVFGHQQHRALGARRLHQVHDLLDDPVLDVASGRAGAPARSPASSAPIAALRGSGDRRLRSSAAATTPNGRVRSKGWAWPLNTARPRERASSTMLCTRRVLPMPASPSIASTDARPSLSWRTAAAARASSASRPTSPSAEDTLKASPRPRQRPAGASNRGANPPANRAAAHQTQASCRTWHRASSWPAARPRSRCGPRVAGADHAASPSADSSRGAARAALAMTRAR